MIKTLIFDFGDVFINLNKESTLVEMEKLGVTSFTEEMLKTNILYETGKISTKSFLSFYKNLFPNVSKKQLRNAWNAIILDFPTYRLAFIEALSDSKNFKLILVSNTNNLHIEQVIKNMGLDKYQRFQRCFDAFYLSQEIQLRKPTATIYKFVLDAHSLKTKECLFIDDTKENINAAKELGIYTWHINPKTEDVTNIFTIKKELF